ncbi:MAG: toxin TcdB middle/C-terminal domain-containing protein [Myxococcales bacterium]
MGGRKPHVLESVVNNLGAETRIGYKSSTWFYLRDKAAGHPWLTRLPFPVQVVDRVEAIDRVAKTKFVTTYSYRHGYFDGYEREFRGFACVEQWDTESFGAERGRGLFSDAEFSASNQGTDLDMPPVRTITWFHTGAWLERERLELALAQEYYRQDPEAPLLEDTRLPPGLSAADEREAARALRGQVLRQEIYGEDETSASAHPYSVSERDYEVRLIQGRLGNAHGVFFTHPRTTISLAYERNPGDRRMSQEFVLDVDEFGNVLRSASIAYPRRKPEEAEQAKLWATVSEAVVTNVLVGGHRLGVPLEGRSYELTGLAPPPRGVLAFDAVAVAARTESVLAYEEEPQNGIQKRLLSHGFQRYYDSERLNAGPLPFGQADARAILYETYQLALTPGLVERAFNGDVLRVTGETLTAAGYCELEGRVGWWVPSARAVPDATRFFQPTEFFDAFGNRSRTRYDRYAVLVERVEDALANTMVARNDYRMLGPAMVTDPNGNRTAVNFDVLGMVVATAVMGKEGSDDGDTLADPTTMLDYDLFRWLDHGTPNFVRTRVREVHRSPSTRWLESYAYSDGSGRVAMTKARVRGGDAPARGADGKLLKDPDGSLVLVGTESRWVGSGKAVLNNKGLPVKQYEPFFSSTREFEDEAELVQWGVTPIMFYDAAGRLIRTVLPHGGVGRVVFTPWEQVVYDEHDTVLEAGNRWLAERTAGGALASDPDEARAARAAVAHANTPTTTKFDTMGRPFLVHARLSSDPNVEPIATRAVLDVEGHALQVNDALGRDCMVSTFGIGGQVLRQISIDAGDRRALATVDGGPHATWDAVGHLVETRFDALRRPTYVKVARSGVSWLASRILYGESLVKNDAVASNTLGKAILSFDGAGLVRTQRYDFKGNLLESSRTLAREYRREPDWSPLEAVVDTEAALVAASDLLEGESFQRTFRFDALNRVIRGTYPDHGDFTKQSSAAPQYDEAGMLRALTVSVRGAADAPFVGDVTYNAQGQRERIAYGNGTETSYRYDPLTLRLCSVATTRPTSLKSESERLQAIDYVYDCVGNITTMRDSAAQELFFSGTQALEANQYVYDALYRLTEATGREQKGLVGDAQRDDRDLPIQNLPHVNDGQALRRYRESYEYDVVGNFDLWTHEALGEGPGLQATWKRAYAYGVHKDKRSNRLESTSLPEDQLASYHHDNNGNMVSMPHLLAIAYTHADQMRFADLGGGGMAFYTYDGGGERARKVIERPGGTVLERIYLGDYEVYRERRGERNELERQTLHVMDGARRVAMVETKTEDAEDQNGLGVSRARYQLGNHLDSAMLECDEKGALISYEEYHPYGTSSFRSARGGLEVSAKRYRYTGKERDEETGFGYHSARYCAYWLGRWTNCDPVGLRGAGPNLYEYGLANPHRMTDPQGTSPTDVDYNAIGPAASPNSATLSVWEAKVPGILPKLGEAPTPILMGNGWSASANVGLNSKGPATTRAGTSGSSNGARNGWALLLPAVAKAMDGVLENVKTQALEVLKDGVEVAAESELTSTAVVEGIGVAASVPESAEAVALMPLLAPVAATFTMVVGPGLAFEPHKPTITWTIGGVDADTYSYLDPSGKPCIYPVVLHPPTTDTSAEAVYETQLYIWFGREEVRLGLLSPTGRVSTKGKLGTEKKNATEREKRRAARAGTPYKGQASHMIDTTWTGSAEPPAWYDMIPAVNLSLGSQSEKYPLKYKPDCFIFAP